MLPQPVKRGCGRLPNTVGDGYCGGDQDYRQREPDIAPGHAHLLGWRIEYALKDLDQNFGDTEPQDCAQRCAEHEHKRTLGPYKGSKRSATGPEHCKNGEVSPPVSEAEPEH